ncbi:EamA family transporter [Sutcliffiella cohnii]|uniref:EamA family transporter n=1 Tax=Sutcliffiella cohnii TaxID=33932 RepID=A0A223KLR4_9BACI|nr:EamA family transporter [Sutcliffiella cohnii]AST90307.1 EamA family transporter [Sutcliffiella cohnii]
MRGRVSILFVLVAAILWGTTGTAQALAPAGVHPISFGAMRLAIGGLTLFVFIWIQGNISFHNWPKKLLFLAVICMTLYQPFFFTAVSMTGIAVGTVIGIGSAPITAGLLEWIVQKKRPTKQWGIATSVAIIGCLLLFIQKDAVSLNMTGVVCAFAAGTSFAGYTLVSKQLIKSHSPNAVVAVVFTLSGMCLLPSLFLFDLTWFLEVNGFVSSLYIGVIATAFAYLLFAKGLMNVSGSTAVTLTLAEPMTAALLGVFLIGETLNWISWIGVFCIFIAIIIISMKPKKLKNDGDVPVTIRKVGG